MGFKSKQLIFLVLLAVASYAVYEATLGGSDQPIYEPFTKGYALTEVTMKTTDENGRISSTLISPSLVHYVDNEMTLIDDPKVTVYSDQGNWYFQSPVAEYKRLEDLLFFPKEVTIQLKNEQGLELQTSAVAVDLTTEQATTKAAISMHQPGVEMQGVGANIFLNTQTIEILDQVYAEYKP